MTAQEKQKMEADIQSQIRYAVGKYSGNRPLSLVGQKQSKSQEKPCSLIRQVKVM